MSLAQLAEWLISPPAGPMLLVLLGLILWRRRAGRAFAAAGLVLLYAAATPLIAYPVIDWLQHDEALDADSLDTASAGAIAVLDAGRRHHAPEYGGATVNQWALERVRYAARLQRLTGLPIVPAGGMGSRDIEPGAELLRRVLREDFGATVPWVEARSTNTMENARLVAAELRRHDIQHVLLVTHALHMPRALWAFRKSDLEVTAAPTGFIATDMPQSLVLTLMPRAGVLAGSRLAVHEGLGRLWYRLRY